MRKCWYCNNELTNGDSPKHFGICNKCYDEMFKSGDTIIRSFTNKISDLEAKLAESEKKYAELFCRNIELETLYSQKTALLNFYKDTDLVEENQQLKEKLEEIEESARAVIDANFKIVEERDKLKQQLSDKEKEIERLKIYDEYRFELPYPKVKILGKTFEDIQELIDKWLKQGSKDKFSFALEQLEQIRKEFEIKFKGCKWEDKMLVGKFCNITNEIIDNQIKELKGEE